ncbi:hypothetical protein RFI_17118, partial [Reticulomyxa filosa]
MEITNTCAYEQLPSSYDPAEKAKDIELQSRWQWGKKNEATETDQKYENENSKQKNYWTQVLNSSMNNLINAVPSLAIPFTRRKLQLSDNARDNLVKILFAVAWRKNETFQEIIDELIHESTWKTNLRAFVAIYSSVLLWIGGWNLITNCYHAIGLVIVWYIGTLYQNAGFQGSNRPSEFFSYNYSDFQQKYHQRIRVIKSSMSATYGRQMAHTAQKNMTSAHWNANTDGSNSNNNNNNGNDNFADNANSQSAKVHIINLQAIATISAMTTRRRSASDNANAKRTEQQEQVLSINENEENLEKYKKKDPSCWRLYHVRFWFLTGISLLGQFILFIGLFNAGDMLYRQTLKVMPLPLATCLWLFLSIAMMANKYVNTLWAVSCVFPPWYQTRRCEYHESWQKHLEMCCLSIISLFGMNMIAVVIQDSLQDSKP